jgi:V8-like Glu-specific endopeptidase
MKTLSFLACTVALAACWMRPAGAQDQLSRPSLRVAAPPGSANAERPGPDLSYRAAKSDEENTDTREIIQQQLAAAQEALQQFDRKRTLAASAGTAIPIGVDDPERRRLAANKNYWQQKYDDFSNESVCGRRDQSFDVELYDGSRGPAQNVVSTWQPSVGVIRWSPNMEGYYRQRGGDTTDMDWGNVDGKRWCTGTLIADNLLLTAAHCFAQNPKGYLTPARRVGSTVVLLPPPELAQLMLVEFNYQRDASKCGNPAQPRTCPERRPDVYPIVRLLEYSRPVPNSPEDSFDYAIAELGPGLAGEVLGKLPGERYKYLERDSTEVSLQNADMLTIIQHPNGDPKRIAAGQHLGLDTTGTKIYYSDVDTMEGSSGAAVLDRSGRIIGVHTSGGCDKPAANLLNSGVTLKALSEVSDLLRSR